MGQIVHKSRQERPETPADRIIRALGARRVAEITQLTTDAVRKWQRRRATGGGGGLVPAQYQQLLLNEARAAGLEFAAEDLIGPEF